MFVHFRMYRLCNVRNNRLYGKASIYEGFCNFLNGTCRREIIPRAFCTVREQNIARRTENIEIPSGSLYDFLQQQLSVHGDKTALVNGITGEEYTYSAVNRLSRSFSVAIGKHGFRKGDIVGLLSFNCPEYAISSLGIQGCQGIATLINPSYTIEEIVYQMKDSGAKMLVVDSTSLGNGLRVADMIGLDKVFVMGPSEATDSGIVAWNDIIIEDSARLETSPQNVDSEDLVFLPYSSGTTGRPKGVMLTHRNIIANILQSSFMNEGIPCDVTLGLLPFFHIYGLVVVLMHNLHDGNKIITLPSFRPESFLKCISHYRIQRLNVVPPLLQFFLKDPLVNNYDLSSIIDITTGAAPCAENIFRSVQDKFADVFIRQGYGLTETSPVATAQRRRENKVGSSGKPVINTEVKIIDTETRQTLAVNQVGEVCIRGPQVMKGYLARPDDTMHCLTEDGWYHTGDLGYIDDDDHLFIVDRIKELIKYKGFQVPPAELEDFLISHPKVSDAAVIGVPDEEAGEVPRAFVVKKGEVSGEELLKYIEANVSRHKYLRGGIEFVEAIPKSQSGKILRRVLRNKEIGKKEASK